VDGSAEVSLALNASVDAAIETMLSEIRNNPLR
jgi:hypothetical protein